MILADGGVPFTSTIVGVITAMATLITAVTALFAVLPAVLKLRREVRDGRAEVQVVHTIVNQQRTDMMRYERALVAALKAAGVEVPADQSLEPEPESRPGV